MPRPFRSDQQERQDLINSYEAEEERLTNVLARKLVLARQEKVDMENELEAEGERVMWAMRRTPDGGDVLVDGLRRENEALRVRLSETERDYLQVVRTNDVYREELIELRMRLGIPIDNLIGLQHLPNRPQTQPSSSIRRVPSSISTSSSPPPSPSPFLPSTSLQTNMTSPASHHVIFPGPHTHTLTYPSVPPPSLSSSFGSPIVTFTNDSELNHSRRSSAEYVTGSRRNSTTSRRGGSVERRVAESGSLVRSRAGSLSGPAGTGRSRAGSVVVVKGIMEGDEIFDVEE
ncbi:hypothetical protein BDZ89DRAFT_1071931 [Hymenopellis radicata]|nr:hypothetical protein BDZ89DRAFT_1071931 [Hymenopellis radicata]